MANCARSPEADVRVQTESRAGAPVNVRESIRMLRWLLLTAVIVVLDLWTKSLASASLEYAQPVVILPVLNLTLVHNTGAAFSMFADAGGWQQLFFIVVASVISVVLVIWIARLRPEERWLAAALALVLGGALGNLYDRVTLGYVVDFVSVHYQGWYFPAFNVADAAITVGAVMIFIDMFLPRSEP